MAFTHHSRDQMIRVFRVFLCIAALLPMLAAGQTRPISADARRGVIQHVSDLIVTVDGDQKRLAPGATIRDRRNLIIVPVALPPEGSLADYVLDANGQILRVWLLTEEEAARPKRRQ